MSALESNLSAHAWLISSWIASGSPMNRVPHDFTKTQDGWALFMRAVPNPNVFLLIDQPERMETVEINDIDDWRRQLGQLYEDVESWAQDYDAEEVATKAQESSDRLHAGARRAGVVEQHPDGDSRLVGVRRRRRVG